MQRGSFLSELGSPLYWKLEEKELWVIAVLKFVIVPSGDSSKDVRERGDSMLLRIAQPLAKAPCLERASSVRAVTTFRQPDFQPQ